MNEPLSHDHECKNWTLQWPSSSGTFYILLGIFANFIIRFYYRTIMYKSNRKLIKIFWNMIIKKLHNRETGQLHCRRRSGISQANSAWRACTRACHILPRWNSSQKFFAELCMKPLCKNAFFRENATYYILSCIVGLHGLAQTYEFFRPEVTMGGFIYTLFPFIC